jgi:hypothetical protein
VTQIQDSGEGEWYITGAHARRAIGYLGAELIERGHLQKDFDFAELPEIWGKALQATMSESDEDPSPIGAPVVSNASGD